MKRLLLTIATTLAFAASLAGTAQAEGTGVGFGPNTNCAWGQEGPCSPCPYGKEWPQCEYINVSGNGSSSTASCVTGAWALQPGQNTAKLTGFLVMLKAEQLSQNLLNEFGAAYTTFSHTFCQAWGADNQWHPLAPNTTYWFSVCAMTELGAEGGCEFESITTKSALSPVHRARTLK